MTDTSREAFEAWAFPILGDNATWKESGECELAWQAWSASREQAQAVEPVGTVTAHRGSVAISWTGKCPSVGASLFAHPAPPAQQVAVPLTNVEIYAIARLHPRIATLVPHVEVGQFARAIEAHHGITPQGAKP